MNEVDSAGEDTRAEALRLMWWLVLPVLTLLVVLTWQQYRQGLADAESGLLRKAVEHAQELQAMAGPAEAHIHDLRRLLESTWHAPPNSGDTIQRLMSPRPQTDGRSENPAGLVDGWTLDEIPLPMRQALGQIWWAPADGSPPTAVWLDRAALFLRTARVAHERAPGFHGSYFAAAEANISWGYPWIDTPTSLAAMGVTSLRALERERLAGVERGQKDVAATPQVLTYWGSPYFGQLDGDLVQSHGSIVLIDGQYGGEVSVDFRVDSLQRLAVQWAELEGARVWIIDRQSNIVADSTEPLIAPPDRHVQLNQKVEIKLASRLQDASVQIVDKVLPAPSSGHLVRTGDQVLFAASRAQSPWTYVLMVPRSTLRAQVLPSLIPNALLGLALLLVFVTGQWLFARWFVTPSLSVLQYLRSLSADASTPQPWLGRRWQGWVRAISKVFERQRKAQEELDAQRETMRQNEKLSAMGTLLAGVAHELNNPLAIVMGRASLLEDRVQRAAEQRLPAAPGSVGEDARRIREAADRCGRIVRTFLNIARQRPATRRSVQLDEVVRTTLEMLGYTLRSRSIEVELDLAAGLPDVQADPDQLGQVLLNLLVNAQQALESVPHPRRLKISTGYSDEPIRTWVEGTVPHVWLQVSDDGPGIPADLHERLFEPFFTTKAPGLGTGLGLNLSRSIAREHGGDLVLLPGSAGASFRLMLPLLPAQPGIEAAAPLQPAAEPGAVQRILVVDDEAELVDVIRTTLETAGYEVASAESGAVALELLDEARFDAVVSDMRMPDIDGRMLWKAIQERSPALARRMLFVTGDALSPDARAMLSETHCPSLDKPFERKELLAAVKSLVQR